MEQQVQIEQVVEQPKSKGVGKTIAKPRPAKQSTAAEKDAAAALDPRAFEYAKMLEAKLAARDASEFEIAEIAFRLYSCDAASRKAAVAQTKLSLATVRSYSSARAPYPTWPMWSQLSFTAHRHLAALYRDERTRKKAEEIATLAIYEGRGVSWIRQQVQSARGKSPRSKNDDLPTIPENALTFAVPAKGVRPLANFIDKYVDVPSWMDGSKAVDVAIWPITK